jgi:hypothetical protein
MKGPDLKERHNTKAFKDNTERMGAFWIL